MPKESLRITDERTWAAIEIAQIKAEKALEARKAEAAAMASTNLPSHEGKPAVLWKESTLCKALQISRTSLWQHITGGAMPPPMKLPSIDGQEGKSNRWDVALVLEWVRAGMPHFTNWQASKNSHTLTPAPDSQPGPIPSQ